MSIAESIRDSIEVLPAILRMVERCLGAWEHAGRFASERADGDDAIFEQVLEGSGASDLGEMLAIIAGRIRHVLADDSPAEPDQHQAAVLIASIAGLHLAGA